MPETEREERQLPEHPGEHRQEGIAETEDHRRAEDCHVEVATGAHHDGFAVALRTEVLRGALRIGAQGAHVHQATDAGLLAGRDDLLRQFDVRVGKILAVGQHDIAAVQDADQVDHRILALHQRNQGFLGIDADFRHLHVGLHDQRLGALAPAGRHGDLDPALREAIGDVGTDETATPEQQDLLDVHVEPRKLFF